MNFIKKVEGFSSQPYYDYTQHTVGYGTKCPTDKYFEYMANGIPKDEAEVLLREVLADLCDTINTKFIRKYNLTLTQHQFDALVSFSFNIGTGWMSYDSTLRNAILNSADENDLVYAFSLYCTAGGKYSSGLITRRLCEANMYLNGVYSNKISDKYGYVFYEANGGTLTYRVQGFICANNSAPVANAIRNADVFLGWYTNLEGGSQVTVLDRTLSGKTLFARWQSSENRDDQSTGSIAVKVTGDVVNIRKGPGTNYGIARQVYQNDILVVSHVTHLTNMMWGKVEDGWICLEYTNYDDAVNGNDQPESENQEQPSEKPTTPENDSASADTNSNQNHQAQSQKVISGTVRVGDLLRIRSGPGTSYATVGYLTNDQQVQILEQTTTDSMDWGRISRGWVCMDYIVTAATAPAEPTEPDTETKPTEDKEEQETTAPSGNTETVPVQGKIIADALRIRSAAGTSHSIVGFYYQNDTVTITEKVLVESVYWGKTNLGWINMDYVLSENQEDEIPESNAYYRKTVIGDCLRIRKAPGTDQKIVGFLYYGDTVEILETTTIDESVWARIDKGWISMNYIH